MPDPDAPGQCMDATVTWDCPPGFLADPQTPADAELPGCVPDPDDCGTDPFGGVVEAPGVIFVRADATSGGDGSRAAPLRAIGAALLKAPTGGTVAIGAGTYHESLYVTRSVHLIGRCAAQVTLAATDFNSAAIASHAIVPSSITTVAGMTITSVDDGINVSVNDMVISRVHLRDTRGAAVVTISDGTLSLRDAVISGNRASAVHSGGATALSGVDSGTLHVSRTRITGCEGLAIGLVGSTLQADELLIDGTYSDAPAHGLGSGVLLGPNAHAVLRRSKVLNSETLGVTLEGPQATLRAVGLLVRGTRPNATTKMGGAGIQVRSGSRATLVGVRCTGSHSVGIKVSGAGIELRAKGLLVDNTKERAFDGKEGRGISVDGGASAVLTDVRVSTNRAVGIDILGADTLVTAAHVVVDHTLPQAFDGELGVGISVRGGAQLRAVDTHLIGNHLVGLWVQSPGSTGLSAAVTRLTIVDTVAGQGTQGFGFGAEFSAGATVQIRGATLRRNVGVGLVVAGVGTRIDAQGLLVADTVPMAPGGVKRGSGIEVGGGAELLLAGSALRNNRYIGLAADTPASTYVRAVGVVVADTSVDPVSKTWGAGVVALDAEVQLLASRVVGNSAVGVYGNGAALVVSDSAVVATGAAAHTTLDKLGNPSGEVEVVADAVLAVGMRGLELRRCAIAGPAQRGRVGVFAVGPGASILRECAVTGYSFGVAAQAGAVVVNTASVLFGNDTNVSAGGLFVPLPPLIVPITTE